MGGKKHQKGKFSGEIKGGYNQMPFS